MKRVVIADDHPLFRGALREAVHGVSPDADIAEAATAAEAESRMADGTPDLLLLDLHMADSQGFSALVRFRRDHPDLPVAVVSGNEGGDVIRRALAFGAAAFIPKSSDLPLIAEALRTVWEGDVWMPEGLDEASESDEEGEDVYARIASLTPAQLRVLEGLKDGRLNKQIAYDMGISEATVKAHVTAIMRKLGVINRTQAVLAASVLDVESQKAVDHA